MESQTYQLEYIPLSIKDIKYSDSKNDPLFLVYASPSFYEEKPGPLTGVFVYEINQNYVQMESTT